MKIQAFKTIISANILLFMVFQSIAQGLSTDDMLRQSIGINPNPYAANLAFMESNNMKMPILNNLDFRTETEDMDIQQQELQLRFDLNSRQEREAYENIVNVSKSKFEILGQEVLVEKIYDEYQRIIDLYFEDEKLKNTSERLLLHQDLNKIYQNALALNLSFNLSSWLENQERIIDLKQDSIESNSFIEVFKNKNNGLAPNWKGIISVFTIEDMISTLEKKASIDDLKNEVEIEASMAEHELELAQRDKWLEFIQLRYQADDNAIFQKEVSLGASFSLPVPGKNKQRVNESALDVIEKKSESRIEKEERARKVDDIKIELARLFSQLEAHRTLTNQLNLSNTYNKLDKNVQISPKELIDIKLLMLNLNEKEDDIKKDIFNHYVELLFENGNLTQEYNINFLQNELNPFMEKI